MTESECSLFPPNNILKKRPLLHSPSPASRVVSVKTPYSSKLVKFGVSQRLTVSCISREVVRDASSLRDSGSVHDAESQSTRLRLVMRARLPGRRLQHRRLTPRLRLPQASQSPQPHPNQRLALTMSAPLSCTLSPSLCVATRNRHRMQPPSPQARG